MRIVENTGLLFKFNIPALLGTEKTSLPLLPERLHSFYAVLAVTLN